jgi:hypothetical protein
MIRNIISGYGRLLGALARIAVIVAACVGFGSLLVYPLWFFATTRPRAYTLVVFLALFAALAVFVAGKLRAGLKGASKEARRKKLTAFARGAAKAAVVVLGACAAVFLVLRGMRAFALVSAVLTVALYGACAGGSKNG